MLFIRAAFTFVILQSSNDASLFPQDVTDVITHLRPAGISRRQKSPAKVSTQPKLSGTIRGRGGRGLEPLTITCAFVPARGCVEHVHAHSPQQMDKRLSLCILIGHLGLLPGPPLGQHRSHLITHHDNIITDVQTNKEAS